MDLEVINMSGICRTCKCVTPDMQSLFEKFESPHNSRIDEMLMACASVQVMYGDGLPAQICQTCVEQLTSAFVFKHQCEKVDTNLREYVKNAHRVAEIKAELQNSDFVESLNTLNNLLNKPQPNLKENIPEDSPTIITPHTETDFIQFMDDNQMLLTCRECAKVFTTLEGLRCHKRVHSGGMYRCKQCDKEYTRISHLQRHEQMHNRGKVHVCKICSKILMRKEDLKRHLVTHLKEKPFSCKTCNRGFNRIDHLHKHVPRCKGETVYACDICNKAFNREDTLEVHKTIHNNQQPNMLSIENLDNISEHYYLIDQDENKEFSDHSDVDDCFEPEVEVMESMDEEKIKEVADIANAEDDSNISEISVPVSVNNESSKDNEFDSECEDIKTVKEEMIAASSDDIDDYDEADIDNEDVDDDSGDNTDPEYLPTKDSSSKVKRGQGNPSKNPNTSPRTKKHKGLAVHKCLECNKEFNRADHLKRHLASHSPIKPFSCTTCTKTFSRRDHLNQHQKLHERQTNLECDICQKTFNRADHLAKHNATKHGIGERIIGEKKFECPLCNKGFTTEKYRDIHVNSHDGKGYRCTECEETFLSKPHLKEHIIKFHDELARKYLCSICGRRFIKNDYLVIHMRRHRGEKPFKCKYCGKGFPRTTDLTIHERYHTGEKPHLCTVCGKGFGRAYNLKVHVRTHTKEKPYQCTYCEAAFAQGNDLKAHVRRHTGERFHCELCTASFFMGYLLTQHKRTVHGLNVLSNIRRLQPVNKTENPDEPPPVIISLPKPVVPSNVV